MSADDVTPERFAELRLLEKHLCASGQMVGACLRESLAALESAWAERDAYLDEVRMTNENEARIMADLLATREERDRLRAELDRLRSAPVAVEVPEKSKNSLSFWKHADGRWFCWDGYANIEMTPSRLLKDGEIHGTPEALAKICEGAGWLWMHSPIGDKKTLLEFMTDALRSNGGE